MFLSYDWLINVVEGFTIIVSVLAVPLTDPATGVTVMIAVIGAVVVLVAVNEILPEPLAANPMAVLLFVQL